MNKLTISKELFSALNSVSRVGLSGTALMFKKDDRVYITPHMMAGLQGSPVSVRLSAGPGDCTMEGDTVLIPSLSSFVSYCGLAGFPSKPCVIETGEETSKRGMAHSVIKFTGKNIVCRMEESDPSFFDKNDYVVPRPRESDPMSLLAMIRLNSESRSDLASDMKNISEDFVSVMIDRSGVTFYHLGQDHRQISRKVDELCTKIGDVEAVDKASAASKYRMITSDCLNLIVGLKTEFDVEFRYIGTSKTDLMCLKAFSSFPGSVPADPVTFYAISKESIGARMNPFDPIE